jgi:hypothetical protein
MLKALKGVLSRAKKDDIVVRECGICNNTQKFFYVDVYLPLEKLFLGWDKHSGCRSYPVKINGDYAALVGDDVDYWVGDFRNLRIDLLQYTIKKVEAMDNDFFKSYINTEIEDLT